MKAETLKNDLHMENTIRSLTRPTPKSFHKNACLPNVFQRDGRGQANRAPRLPQLPRRYRPSYNLTHILAYIWDQHQHQWQRDERPCTSPSPISTIYFSTAVVCSHVRLLSFSVRPAIYARPRPSIYKHTRVGGLHGEAMSNIWVGFVTGAGYGCDGYKTVSLFSQSQPWCRQCKRYGMEWNRMEWPKQQWQAAYRPAIWATTEEKEL